MRRPLTALLFWLSTLPAFAYEIIPVDRILGDRALALAEDGRTVVGNDLGPDGLIPLRWTRETGAVELGYLSGYLATSASDVSADGTVIAGSGVPHPYEAHRWTQATGMIGVGPLAGFDGGTLARAISADGSTIVGIGYDQRRAFKWNVNSGFTVLPQPPGNVDTEARDVSADGKVIAVTATYYQPSGSLDKFRAHLWSASGGLVEIGPLPQGWSSPSASQLSADGSVLLGTGSATSLSGTPFLWTHESGIESLPLLNGESWGSHVSMTPDASVVVGNQFASDQPDDPYTAVVWDRGHGTRRLHDVLLDEHGFEMDELIFNYVRGISADRKTLLVRSGIGPSAFDYKLWIVDLDKPLVEALPGDFNADGAVDGADFLAWQQGHSPLPLSAEDLSAWKMNFGHPGTASGAAAVPEPTSVALTLAAALAAATLRRTKPRPLVALP
jgi:uncharacterized membrane protein